MRKARPTTSSPATRAVSDPQLVQKPDGTIYLYFGGSTPDLKTAGPLRRRAGFCSPPRRNADFLAGRDRLRQRLPGDNGETLNNDFSSCCGYYESPVVESSGQAQLAFWSATSLRSKARRFGTARRRSCTRTPKDLRR
jgi:hypothetical protein